MEKYFISSAANLSFELDAGIDIIWEAATVSFTDGATPTPSPSKPTTQEDVVISIVPQNLNFKTVIESYDPSQETNASKYILANGEIKVSGDHKVVVEYPNTDGNTVAVFLQYKLD